MDNYLKISSKLYNMRDFLERSHGDMFERRMYLAFLKLEDELNITQCHSCGEYDFIQELIEEDNTHSGVELICNGCYLIKIRR